MAAGTVRVTNLTPARGVPDTQVVKTPIDDSRCGHVTILDTQVWVAAATRWGW
jgi:hypothetical protein